MKRSTRNVVLLTVLCFAGCKNSDPASSEAGVHVASAAEAQSAWEKGAMVSAANPHAVEAAIEMLRNGGHAVDAAIAAHAVLGLVEPQSSGIGGGAFLLVYEKDSGELTFLDGRESAPAGATVDMFVRDGEVMSFLEAWQSGLSVGVPGAVALYKRAHEEHGKLSWAEVFQPAIRLADSGFIVSPRLAASLKRYASFTRLDDNPETAAYFYPKGVALQAGALLTNPEYADTLRRISSEGIDAFYKGEIPQTMVSAAHAGPDGGTLTVEDIASYEVIERPVICGSFRTMKICTTSPPSSGVAQIMIPELYDHLSTGSSNQADKVAAFVDAQRLAYADRDHFIGDPEAIEIPVDDLIDPRYLEYRAGERFAPDQPPTHGDPGLVLRGEPMAALLGEDLTVEASGTTHLSIIDQEGNAISMTATIEGAFGSSRWAHGFLLNNEMTDFARQPPADGAKVANAISPGKRPRSSMSPTMVFDSSDDILMITGSPGGNSIPAYVAKSIIGVLDWGLSAQQAVDHPNIIARGEKVRVEIATDAGKAIALDLQERGYQVQEREGENSGLHVILVRPDGLEGAADKRREGIVKQLP